MRPLARIALALAVASSFLGLSATVQAQIPCRAPRPCGEPPTAGVAVPTGAIAGGMDASSIELDPADLAFLPAWSAFFVHSELDTSGVRPGRGDALYLATPIPYLPQVAVGFAVQSIRPPSALPYRDLAKISLSLAWRPVRSVAFGATYSHIVTGDTPETSGLDTIDLAASARFNRWLGIALVVRDVPGAQFQGLALQRVYEPELTLRPVGSDRWEMGFAARIGERRGDVDPRFRLSVMPASGLVLRGAVEWKRDVDGDRHADNDFRATVGLELDLAHVGAAGYALFGSRYGGSYFHGGAATARLSGERWPSLYTPRHLERIDVGGGGERGLTALLAHLRKLEHDPRSDGVVLVMGDVSGTWATMEEVRDALSRLRAAGKHVFAYGAEITTKGYYLASAAEKIYLDPAGGIRLVGMASAALYFKGTFDLLGVQADFIKIAEYKSAPEQYTRTAPSPEAKRVKQAILDDIYGRLVATLATARKVDADTMRAIIDAGPYTAAEAKRAGLADELKHGDEVEDAIAVVLGHPVEASPPDRGPRRARSWQPPEVAVIFIEGDIVDGKSQTIPILDLKLVGHKTIIEAIADARSDSRVKAIVLRIDSPGGSALASDLMAREIARTAKVKPVVCSFGDVAASGGYFIAAGCDLIFASPSTITGSIGIFTGKFDISGLAAKLGVNADLNKRGAHADLESLWLPYSPEDRAFIEEKLRYYYNRFVDTVAEGRHMKHDEVDAIARGRVWTGAQAKEKKLVDRLGGFMDAVVEAKRRAGLAEWEPVELKAYPDEPSSLLGQLARLLGVNLEAPPSLASLPFAAEILRGIPGSLLASPSTPQARLEWNLSAPR
ncbi:MAG: signal peptide peptidase SppA [Myxococcales bacterium]|nr:signal peptide peptidase SppA [Myxococcales bacterium]